MKNLTRLLQVLLTTFILSTFTAASQKASYPFEAKISGQGKQSIIFIPGFACSGEVWNETKVRYEKEYTCYTLTMAGFAGVNPQPDASFKNWEAGIAAFIKNNKIEKPILVGHSMGGGLALAVAADYPELISKIIVVDALPCLAALMNPTFKSKENNDCSEMTTRLTSMTDAQFLQMQNMNIGQLMADTLMQAQAVSWSVRSDRKTFAEMYCDFSNTDLREKISAIHCPVLILLEPSFKAIKPSIEDQYKNLKGVNLQYAGKGLHFIMFDDREWYFNQLSTFIRAK